MLNQSEQPDLLPDGMPPITRKWNWGAFMATVFWGIGNRTYISLLALIPFVNLVWCFVMGWKGNKWAWEAGNFKNTKEDIEKFEAIQATWSRAGWIMFLVLLAVIVFYMILFFIILSMAANS